MSNGEAWRNRLIALATDAANDDLPGTEQALLLAAVTVNEPYRRQRTLAHLFYDLNALIANIDAPPSVAA